MPQLVFPIRPDGLAVDVLVNLDATKLVPLRSRGAGLSPVQGRGLIDTGSDITVVSLPILQQLAIPPSHQTVTQAIGGSVPVQLFLVSLHILDLGNLRGPWFSHPTLLVMGLPGGLPFDVLVGLDVLRTCKLVVDGPLGKFSLDF